MFVENVKIQKIFRIGWLRDRIYSLHTIDMSMDMECPHKT